MKISEWQRRLEKNFLENSSEFYIEIELPEMQFEEFIESNFIGFKVMALSSLVFFHETLRIVLSQFLKDNNTPHKYYTPVLVQYIANFKNLRATYILFEKGYPFDGFALLRDLSERAIFYAAAGNKYITIPDLFGHIGLDENLENITDEQRDQIQNKIKETGKKAVKELLGNFRQNYKQFYDELEILRDLFNREVHSSKLTYANQLIPWVKGMRSPSLGPIDDDEDQGLIMYMNRFAEIGWMHHRLLPLLQFNNNSFDTDWKDKWIIIDESFHFLVKSLSESGLLIADAIIKLLDTEFNFNPSHSFCEYT